MAMTYQIQANHCRIIAVNKAGEGERNGNGHAVTFNAEGREKVALHRQDFGGYCYDTGGNANR